VIGQKTHSSLSPVVSSQVAHMISTGDISIQAPNHASAGGMFKSLSRCINRTNLVLQIFEVSGVAFISLLISRCKVVSHKRSEIHR
jgi:hypothetical protein